MSKFKRLRSMLISALAAPVLLLPASPTVSAAPLVIDTGPLFLTTVSLTAIDLGPFGLVELTGNPPLSAAPPGDFSLSLAGGSFSPDQPMSHALSSAVGPNTTDTIFDITSPVTLTNVGHSGTVDIELVAMSLKSISPIELFTLAGLQDFDVFLDIDPSAVQGTGSMTIIRETETTGSFVYTLPEDLVISYVNITNPLGETPAPQRVFVNIQGGEGTFIINQTVTDPVTDPATLALFGLGLVGLGAMRRRRTA